MAGASFVTLHLARFDSSLRGAGTLSLEDRPGALFCAVAADIRAAGTEPASQQAFTFLILGLHAHAASAQQLLDSPGEPRSRVVPER